MSLKKLIDIIPVGATVEFGEDGSVAICPNGQRYPLEKSYGPCRPSVDKGEIEFLDPVDLPFLQEDVNIVLIFDCGGGFRLWTLEPWLDGALRRRQGMRVKHNVDRHCAREEQGASRKRGQRRGREITNHVRTQHAPSAEVTADGRRALNLTHDAAVGAFSGVAFAGLEWPGERVA